MVFGFGIKNKRSAPSTTLPDPKDDSPPPKRFKPVVEVAGGLVARRHIAIWKINSYVAVLAQGDLINTQTLTINAKDNGGQGSSWIFSFVPHNEDPNWLGISWKLTSLDDWTVGNDDKFYRTDNPETPISEPPRVCAKVEISIKNQNGETCFSNSDTETSRPRNVSLKDSVLEEKIIWKDCNLQDLPLIDDDLVIQIQLTIYSCPSTTSNKESNAEKIQEIKMKFQDRFNHKYQMDLHNPWKIDLTPDIIIKTQENEVKVCGELLKKRSPSLRNMINDRKDGDDNLVELGVSYKSLEILLDYWYTGRLGESWSDSENVQDFVRAVVKLEVKELIEYLDAILGKMAWQDKCLIDELYYWANTYLMETAAKELWELGLTAVQDKKTGTAEKQGNAGKAVMGIVKDRLCNFLHQC